MVCFTFLVIIRRCLGDRDINAILRSPGRTGDTQEESKPEKGVEKKAYEGLSFKVQFSPNTKEGRRQV